MDASPSGGGVIHETHVCTRARMPGRAGAGEWETREGGGGRKGGGGYVGVLNRGRAFLLLPVCGVACTSCARRSLLEICVRTGFWCI